MNSCKDEYLSNGEFAQLIKSQHYLNTWHTESAIIQMLNHFSNLFNEKNLEEWISKYQINNTLKTPVLVKPNLNYSFGGIHEWLCCIITQTPFVLKANANQFQLLKFLSQKLTEFDPGLDSLIDIGEQNKIKPQKFILHSEQNQSLSLYFREKKALIIEPRPSIAVLTGEETPEELYNLGIDIFLHLGQTSGTLRKIYIPGNFDIKRVIDAIEPFLYVYQNNKYANNYDYHQSVNLMERVEFLDNGFLVIKEDLNDDAPTGCLFYEYYNDIDLVINKIQNKPYENLICTKELPLQTIKPGRSHFHELWQYPNHVDIVKFLLD